MEGTVLNLNVGSGGTGSGGTAESVKIKNAAGTLINPARKEDVEAITSKLSSDPATQTTLADILVKLADPATQTTLAAVLAKLSGDPATQTTLAAILEKFTDGLHRVDPLQFSVIKSGTTSTTEADAYTIGDVVGTKIEIANAARVAAGGGIIVWARLICDNLTTGTHAIKDLTKQKFKVHIYHTDPGAYTDDAAYKYLSANATKRLGAIDFTMKDSTNTSSEISVAIVDGVNRNFVLPNGATSLYAIIADQLAWNPTSGTTTFTLELGIIQF
jgi:hypothetical protein